MIDPDHVIIHRSELQRLHDRERELKNLEAKLAQERRQVEEALKFVGGDIIIETKDGLRASYRVHKGFRIGTPLQLPCRSSRPAFDEAPCDAVTPRQVRTYVFVCVLSDRQMPLYREG